MSKIGSQLKNENGSVIVVALIILALLTILGIAGTNTSTLEVRIATNSQNHQLDFYVADSGWKDAAMFLENQSAVPGWINGAGTIVKNFGSDGNTFTGEPPAPDFTVLTPDSLHDGDGIADSAGESAFNSRYHIDYFYEVEHLPDSTSKVPGSGMKYRRHFFQVISDAKRQEFNHSTAEVMVNLSKIYATGYN